jgi:HSP90 family molecular chaperone
VFVVQTTGRLRDSPAIVAAPENALLRRLMKLTDAGTMNKLPRQRLEINPAHPVIVKLFTARDTDPSLARAVCEQVRIYRLGVGGSDEKWARRCTTMR